MKRRYYMGTTRCLYFLTHLSWHLHTSHRLVIFITTDQV